MYNIVQDAGVFCLIYSVMATICFFVGSCWLFISFAKDITNDLFILNVKRSLSPNQVAKFKGNFVRFMHIYTGLKKLRQSCSVEFIDDERHLLKNYILSTAFSD